MTAMPRPTMLVMTSKVRRFMVISFEGDARLGAGDSSTYCIDRRGVTCRALGAEGAFGSLLGGGQSWDRSWVLSRSWAPQPRQPLPAVFERERAPGLPPSAPRTVVKVAGQARYAGHSRLAPRSEARSDSGRQCCRGPDLDHRLHVHPRVWLRAR